MDSDNRSYTPFFDGIINDFSAEGNSGEEPNELVMLKISFFNAILKAAFTEEDIKNMQQFGSWLTTLTAWYFFRPLVEHVFTEENIKNIGKEPDWLAILKSHFFDVVISLVFADKDIHLLTVNEANWLDALKSRFLDAIIGTPLTEENIKNMREKHRLAILNACFFDIVAQVALTDEEIKKIVGNGFLIKKGVKRIGGESTRLITLNNCVKRLKKQKKIIIFLLDVLGKEVCDVRNTYRNSLVADLCKPNLPFDLDEQEYWSQADKKALKELEEEYTDIIIKLFPSDINQRNKHGNSLLNMAARAGLVDVIDKLIEKEAIFNINRLGDSPFHDVARAGHLNVLNKLIQKEAMLNLNKLFKELEKKSAGVIIKFLPAKQVDDKGDASLLHIAVCYGLVEVVNKLIEKKARFNIDRFGGVPSYLVVKSKIDNQIIIEPLLDEIHLYKGTPTINLVSLTEKINLGNAKGETALHLATIFNRVNIAKILLDKGADPEIQNFKAQTALHLAVIWANKDILEMLLERKADYTVENDDNKTALEIAYMKKKTMLSEVNQNEFQEIIEILRNVINKALRLAVIEGNRNRTEYLLKKQAEPNASDENGQTALHLGVMNGHVDIVQILLRSGADCKLKNNANETALDIAWIKKENMLDQAMRDKFQAIVWMLRNADGNRPNIIFLAESKSTLISSQPVPVRECDYVINDSNESCLMNLGSTNSLNSF